jgi:hypothetical protein
MAAFTALISPPQQEKKLRLEVTVQEAETIVLALRKMPYDQVALVIQNVVTQAQRQLADTVAFPPGGARPDTVKPKTRN